MRLHVSADYEKMSTDVLSRGMELSWMPPIIHARTVALGAEIAAVPERAGLLSYRAAIVVRADSPFQAITDLAGARFAWTDKNSASGYVFTRLHCIAAGLDPKTAFANEHFYGSLMAACTAVYDGSADVTACHVSEASANDFAQALRDVGRHVRSAQRSLRVLDVTLPIPPDAIVFAPGVTAEDRKRVRQALIALHLSPAGALAVKDLLSAERLVAVSGGLQAILDGAAALAAKA